MNFVERRYILKYFTVFDIMSKIGGFRASVMPIVGEFAPFFVLAFLVQLSKIIQEKLKEQQLEGLKNFMLWTKKQLFYMDKLQAD